MKKKTGIVQTLLRLLCCALILFPHSVLAGSASIPGFKGSVPSSAPASRAPGNMTLNIPGFYNGASVPVVPTTAVPVPLPGGRKTGLDTSKGDQNTGIAGTDGQVTVYQNQQNAIIDWQSFNIGSNSSVHFDQQGNASWSALNRIWDANPSQIYGRLTADGKIYLINQNGILFGPGSRVNVNSLTASALNITNDDFLGNILQFKLTDYQGLSNLDPLAAVSNHGEIEAANGGYVFLLAPRVENFGVINAPAGQAGLAAGTEVWLSPPKQDDLSRAGYYVIVKDNFINAPQSNNPDFGRAVNNGSLYSDGGMAGMYGNNVDQWGVIRSVTAFQNKKGQVELRAANKITTGANSSIDLRVDESLDPETGLLRTVNDTFDIQPEVFIGGLHTTAQRDTTLTANLIELRGSIVAPAGDVKIRASERVYLETDSSIDVSGAVADLSLPVIAGFKLTSVELRDDYAQKDGVVPGQKITTSTTAGSTIGDLDQAILTRERTAQERLSGGAMTRQADGSYKVASGTIDISAAAANGDIIVRQGALLDFSGGYINYEGGFVNSTKLLSGMKVYDISNAPANITYDKILGNYTKTYDRFGIRETYSSPLRAYMQGYTQGGDAGVLTLTAPTVVLDGELHGGVTRGLYQNTWTMEGSFSEAQDYDNARALSKAQGLEAPLAGTLNIGLNESTRLNNPQSISVLSETEPQTELTVDSPLPTGQTTLISAKTLNDANLGSLNLAADLTINTAAEARLILQPGGSFSATARQIDHQGSIEAPAGSITLHTVQNLTSEKKANGNSNEASYIPLDEKITLGSGSRLDASGEKIDNSQVGMSDTDSLRYGQTAGGSISIMDKTDNGTGVFIQADAVVDVSGGYSIDQKGKITGGNAGSLSIQGANIQLNGDLRGYALADPNGKVLGGAITIASTEIHVGSGASAPQGSFVLAGDGLKDTGFTRITLKSINDLEVESDTIVNPSLVRLKDPMAGGGTGASAQVEGQGGYGTELPGRPDLILLDDSNDFMAGPSSFVAEAGVPFVPRGGTGFTGNLKPIADESSGRITISPGAVIRTTQGGSIALTGYGRSLTVDDPSVAVYGTLDSPGGNISINAKNGDLLVGDNASILATGYNRPDPSSTPKGFSVNYQPMNGGNVALEAYGDLTIAALAKVDVSGSNEVVENTVLRDGQITTYNDASNPGSVSLTYGENGGNLIWQGAVTARHAELDGLSGGSLKISKKDPNSGMDIKNVELGYYLNRGFDDLTFKSQNSLIFREDIHDITIGRKLTLDAPEIKTETAGTDVTLSAPWIVLTNTTDFPKQQPSPPKNGSELELSGQWIDVIGDMNFSGFNDVTLEAARDIRLSQVLYDNNVVGGEVTNGKLATSGNLVLDAERIYPGNYYSYKNGNNIIYPDIYSDYTIHADGKVILQHTSQSTDAAGDRPIYSAGGSLIVEGLGGIDVENGVTLAAPLGTIKLDAPGKRIYLAEGSVLTTVGNADVTYGIIDAGNIWVTWDKADPGSADHVTTVSEDNLPDKGVTLNADEVIAREGSVIDVSGGGSVFAYKFQPGVEGSVDPLAKPGRYIVFKDNACPQPGQAVHLEGGAGLSEGDYTLLPLDEKNPQNARYAFLPDAYIIEKQSTKSLPGESSLSKDGYPLIVGYAAVADTTIRDTRGQVYSVRSAQDVLTREGHYLIQSVTSGDAGAIDLAGKTTIIDGTLAAAALSGYRGGTISLAATDVIVQSSAGTPLSDGFGFGADLDPALRGKLTVSADSLSGKGFSEVSLGDENTTNSVTVKAGAELDATALVLNAKQSITVESNVRLGKENAEGLSGTNEITLATSGDLSIAANAVVHAYDNITLDVNNVDHILGELKVDNSAITLKSSAIMFGSGEKEEGYVGLYLAQDTWNRFTGYEKVALVSGYTDVQNNVSSYVSNEIQFKESFNLSAADSLTLDASRIVGLNNASVTVSAPTVNLRNSGELSNISIVQAAGMGTFAVKDNTGKNINVNQINVGGGDVVFGGFSTIALNSTYDLAFAGRGSLTTGNADLHISAARVTTASTERTAHSTLDKTTDVTTTAIIAPNFTLYTGANYHQDDQNNSLSPAGAIVITGSGGTPAETSNSGGMLEFQGTSIDQGGVIQVDGGSIKMAATDGITLQTGSRILAQGTGETPGGMVALRADNGSIDMKPSSLIDVSAGYTVEGDEAQVSQGDAGVVILQAPHGGVAINGELLGKAHEGGVGGSLVVDTYQVSNADPGMINTDMTQLLGTLDDGGFIESVDIRARKGDIEIAAGQALQARHVKLTADDKSTSNGEINIAGQISGTEGGSVELYAMNDLTIQSGGSIRAASSASDSSDPDVLLSSTNGSIIVNGKIDVSGGDGIAPTGVVYLRAQRNQANDDMNASIGLQGSIVGAAAVYAEAFIPYDISTTTPDEALSTGIGEATAFYDTYLNNPNSFGSGNSNFHLLPGIELVSAGGIDFAGMDLTTTKFGVNNDVPGVLTVRAGGDLNINGDLTDYPAFVEASASGEPNTSAPTGLNTWTFNLAAGADTSSADYMAVNVNTKGTGNLKIEDYVTAHTESAPIRFASGGNTIIGKGKIPGYMISWTMSHNLSSFNGSIQGRVGRDLTVAGAIQTGTGDIDISVGRDLNLLVVDDPMISDNPGAGAIRTTGRLSSEAIDMESNPIGTYHLDARVIDPATGHPLKDVTQSDPNGAYYWRYDEGGSINLSVGRHAGKKSGGQWAIADTGTWDDFSEIEVSIPPQAEASAEASAKASYGIFSADYEHGTAGLAAMGGGDLTVRTGGDFLVQAGTFGAGDLSIYSGGDIKGRFLNKDGQGEFHAMGNFGTFDPDSRKNERAQLELFNSTVNVTARGEIQIGAVLNPTLASDQIDFYKDNYFVQCTYTPETSIKLKAGTDVIIDGKSPYYHNNSSDYERVLPATVNVDAAGDIILLNNFTLASSPTGNLSLTAGGDVLGNYLDNENRLKPASILVSDMSPQNWYGLFSVYQNTNENGGAWLTKRIRNPSNKEVPKNHGLYNPKDNTISITEPLHTGDEEPIIVHADGDISNLAFVFPKKAEVTAGGDIRDITYEGQNIGVNDVSMIRAGGDISMQYVKASSGDINSSDNQPHDGMIQGGPGVFMVQAGGSIELGSPKDGIQAVGNGSNVALSSEKSDLIILSGYRSEKSAAEVAEFFNTVRTAGDEYAQLMAEGKLDEADHLLQATRDETITPFLGEPTGAGNINMTSSQIATTIGKSDIYVIANGSLNLGQTALPIAGKANKKTGITTGGGGDINIFARQDVNVNESRVMTFYGGDITVWSDDGSINAGRGSRTAVSAQPPKKQVKDGVVTWVFTPPAAGSGLRAVTYGDNAPEPGNIHLFAPSGVIDAGEAGIEGGQIILAALKVNNASNISFGAGSIGMPQASEGAASLGSLAGSGPATQNTQLAADSSGLSAAKTRASQMVEDIIAKWLDVKVIDFVEDEKDEKDEEEKKN